MTRITTIAIKVIDKNIGKDIEIYFDSVVATEIHINVTQKAQLPVLYLMGCSLFSVSIIKISSTLKLNNCAILQANTTEGLYLPFSNATMVCLETPTLSENSS